MRREISTATINSDIQKISNSTNVSDGFNTFDDLYMTALAFVHMTLTNNKDIHLYINIYPTFFEVRLFDDDAMFPEWDMKFPLRYLDTILKLTP